MAYSSDPFIFLLPVFLALFFAVGGRRAQNALLGVVSLLFLGWTGAINVAVALAMIGVALGYLQLSPEARDRAFPWVLVILLGNLAFFKYRVFIADAIGLPLATLPGLVWAVPLGISFYTFQLIASLHDAPDIEEGRRRQSIQPGRFALFVLFFPHLIAGPICRIRQLYPQFAYAKRLRARFLSSGGQLFTVGYCKKVLIADPIARAIDPLWATTDTLSTAAAWLIVIGFYIQVYADFSGYTDMGRGIARAMGFRLPINFRAPYLAATPVEFWSRWHITLSNFAKAYIYNPLAVAIARHARWARRAGMLGALVATMVLLGLWHGAAWRFVLFGVVQGLLLAAWYGVTGNKTGAGAGRWLLGASITQGALILSFVLFRAETPVGALRVFGSLAGSEGLAAPGGLALLILASTAAVFAVQAIDYFATRKPVAAWLLLPRRLPLLGLVIAGLFVVAFAVKRQMVGAGGAAFERFIYFDF